MENNNKNKLSMIMIKKISKINLKRIKMKIVIYFDKITFLITILFNYYSYYKIYSYNNQKILESKKNKNNSLYLAIKQFLINFN